MPKTASTIRLNRVRFAQSQDVSHSSGRVVTRFPVYEIKGQKTKEDKTQQRETKTVSRRASHPFIPRLRPYARHNARARPAHCRPSRGIGGRAHEPLCGNAAHWHSRHRKDRPPQPLRSDGRGSWLGDRMCELRAGHAQYGRAPAKREAAHHRQARVVSPARLERTTDAAQSPYRRARCFGYGSEPPCPLLASPPTWTRDGAARICTSTVYRM